MAIRTDYFDTQYYKPNIKSLLNQSHAHAQVMVTNYELLGILKDKETIDSYVLEEHIFNACVSESEATHNLTKIEDWRVYGSDAIDCINLAQSTCSPPKLKLAVYYKPRKGGYSNSTSVYDYGINTRRGSYRRRYHSYRYQFQDDESSQRLMLNEYGLSSANSYNGRYIINKDIAICLRTEFTEFTELNVTPLTFGIKTLKFYAST